MMKKLKIKKFMIIDMLKLLKEENCNTLDEAIELLNKELQNDCDIAYTFEIGGE